MNFALGSLIKERLVATEYFKSSQLVIIITPSIGRRGNIFSLVCCVCVSVCTPQTEAFDPWVKEMTQTLNAT